MNDNAAAKKEVKYAKIGDRLFAAILDLTLLAIIVIPLSSFAFPAIFGEATPLQDAVKIAIEQNPDLQYNEEALTKVLLNNHSEALTEAVALGIGEALFQFSLMAFYFVPLTAKKGRTFGKLILGIRVLDSTNNENISLSQATIRYLSYIPSALPIFLGFIWGSFRKDRRTWHDLLADSIVIYDDQGWYKILWRKVKSLFSKK